jgi:hypothetical protein
MNIKAVKYIVTSLIVINCLAVISKPTIATTNSYSFDNLNSSTYYAHKNSDKKDKPKGFNVFSEENYKYISPEQKKELLELKKCKDKGDNLSEDQQKALHSIIDCIIKGKLGDKNYADFKCLIEKKQSNGQLSEEENKRLKDYTDIIDGSKLSSRDIFNQFLR